MRNFTALNWLLIESCQVGGYYTPMASAALTSAPLFFTKEVFANITMVIDFMLHGDNFK